MAAPRPPAPSKPAPLLTVFREKLATMPLMGVFALVAVALAVGSLVFGRQEDRLTLRMTAGDLRSHRAEIARALVAEAAPLGLDIELVEAPGSAEAAERVQGREIGAALVQGGLEVGEDVREVAPLTIEPLHLLIGPDASVFNVEDLRGLRVQLSPPGSGTRTLALDVLALGGMDADDVTEVSMTYAELEEAEPEELPEALFTVSSLPSPTARFLLHERDFTLLALPVAGAIALSDVAVLPSVIPAYTYGAAPPVPREDLTTIGTRMIVIAHRDTPNAVVRRLLEALGSPRFLRRANLRPPLDDLTHPELPLHAGTIEWQRRDDPLFTSETVQGIESFRSFLVSLVVAGVLLWRWWRSRQLHGLDRFLREVSAIEAEALEVERAAVLELGKLLPLRARLGDTKSRALAAFADGKVHSEELLGSFLTHVSDVRSHLNAMILHERERMEKKARTLGDRENDALREMWEDALQEEHGDRELAPSRPAAGAAAGTSKKPEGKKAPAPGAATPSGSADKRESRERS